MADANTHYSPMRPKGYQQLTVSNTPVLLTIPTITQGQAGPNYAMIRVSTAGVRYRDGTAVSSATAVSAISATSAIGFPILTNEIINYDGDLANVAFIRSSGTDATLDILYYRVG